MAQCLVPGSLRELEQIVAWAVSEETAVEVAGQGTKSGLGRPVDAGYRLSTSGLAGIDNYEPEELVMSCGAGTPLAEIEAALAERGQQLGFEPYDFSAVVGEAPGRQTIGGVIAANISGPRRLTAGAARDHVLGLQAVSGHGQIVKTGGRVVKNVTGYDLCKLLTGSFGTLAVISHLTFKTLPAPPDETTLVLHSDSLETVAKALRQATGSAYAISAAALIPGDGYQGFIRLEGTSPSIAYRVDRLDRLLGDTAATRRLERDASRAHWRRVRDAGFLPSDAPVIWRISIPPSDLGELVGSLDGRWFADWAGGLVWYAGGPTRPRLPGSGHATLVKSPAALRATLEPFQPQAAPLRALSARLKTSFDPKAVLNPGRMYAGI